ncbi:MAG: hypothetical protein O2816_13280 [Planctomycetota bacterium]|nr:hypothetical protein [Planctomycetota bacterium]
MFEPPRCPYKDCRQHKRPEPGFAWKMGSYKPKCRAHPVPRFECQSCLRTFSRQTFRADYRDHKPHLNPQLFQLLASGVGLRQSARNLGLSLRCTEVKFRKIAAHLRDLSLNLRGPLEGIATMQFDEFESYEGCRNTRPVTIPMLIETSTRFIIWSECAPIRPRGKMTPKRIARIEAQEAIYGERKDESRRAIRRTLQAGAALVKGCDEVVFCTDEKKVYPSLAKAAFCGVELRHHTTNSKLARGTWNPLFPINHSEAMVRDLTGRVRRDSWLTSKEGWCLDLGLQLYMAYRNYVRRRFNRDKGSPAVMLGFVERRMHAAECLSWRQDWGPSSPHPLGDGGRLVSERVLEAAA